MLPNCSYLFHSPLPSATQLLSNKQAFISEVKKLLWMKLIHLDEKIYLFYEIPKYYLYCYTILLILDLSCTIVQLYSDLTVLTYATTYLICDIKP